MDGETPILDVRGLTIALPAGADRRLAVDAVSFTVRPREIVCLVGESGSGKSVTGFSVMGLLPKTLRATGGQVLLAGEDMLQATPQRLRELRCTRMSMVFQEPMTALNPVMTCGEQIDEVLRAHTTLDAPARQRRIVDLLGRVRMTEPERMAAAYPHQLSGGQRQRIMIAMAVALEPALIIADEPTTALDVTTQAQILELIKDIQRQFATGVLFITHDFGVVAEIAHRVAVMRHGRLVEFGPAADVLSHPREAYTRMLIAAVPGMAPPARAPAGLKDEVLRVDRLAKTYETGGWLGRKRSVNAAAGVSLCVRRGETLGIVGESGSGKSTVARCVARLVDPSAGRILIGGQDIARLAAGALRPFRRKVQVIFQDPYRSLNPRRTIRQSMVEGPMNYGLGAVPALERATALLDLVGLEAGALDRYPHQFSGGQRQRICIARALAMEPELLIADEPVSALDVSVQAQVLDLIEDVRRRLDLAILFITHDLRVAARVCDRVAVMRRGEVVEEGLIEAVFLEPRHEYTRALLAAAPGKDWQFGALAAG
ncbi:MAG: ABC transporter ATP-binding protein [Alphaproteobacteria bacterium]|nr:ABC transporter ATP-binding protein [Alphaproteobacteria bacterium]